MVILEELRVALDIWGIVFGIITITSLYLTRELETDRNYILMIMVFFATILLCCDGLCVMFDGKLTIVAFWVLRISKFLVYFSGYMLMAVVSQFSVFDIKTIGGRTPSWYENLLRIVTGISVVMLIVSQFTGLFYSYENNVYTVSKYYWSSLIAAVVIVIIDIVLIIINRKLLAKGMFFAFAVYLVLPALALIVQVLMPGVIVLNVAIMAGVLLVFFTDQTERSKRIVAQERELNENKISILRSQIQPHFMFNSLTTIRYLIKMDPDAAIDAIDAFSGYLRGSMESLSMTKPISFDQEMKLVHNYLDLEKRRFGESLNIVYDIKESDFLIPALSVQPIAENAVRHGIRGSIEGGTLKISSFKDEHDYCVVIEDNGVGFDVNEVKHNDGRTHVGVSNVKNRIQLMCNGTFELESKKGVGTRVTLRIPARG